MMVDTQTQAILLLTAWLDKSSREDARPLSPTEWGRFANWLNSRGRTPAHLLESMGDDPILAEWDDPSVSRERIAKLMARSATLGMVLEKWKRAGLWVLSRADADYPKRLKSRLGPSSPALLIGCGSQRLLNTTSIAVVGSRDASSADIEFTETLGRIVAAGGCAVVSGGARGVDEAAMLSTIAAGGQAVGILADSLLRSITKSKFRSAIESGQLVLVSPFNPEASFSVGNAMARNKYIYCCAGAAVVVATGTSKGGTWTGAMEALRAGWVPVWTRVGRGTPTGNRALVRNGALEIGESVPPPSALISGGSYGRAQTSESLFESEPSTVEPLPTAQPDLGPSTDLPTSVSDVAGTPHLSLFELFIAKLAEIADPTALTVAEIAARLGIERAQATAWLNQALVKGRVIKQSRPVRYRIAPAAKG